jgi:hypothetical protein
MAQATPSLSELTPQQQQAVVVLARMAAVRQIKAQRKRQGLREVLPMSVYSRMAIDLVEANPAFLLEAAASPIVQNLRITSRRRRPDRKGELLCESHERNGGQQ